MALEILLILGGVVVGAFFVWLITRDTGNKQQGSELSQHLGALHQNFNERLDYVTQQVNQRLKENVQAMNESKTFLTERVSSNERAIRESTAASHKTIREVTAKLGQLEEAARKLDRSTEEISSFQNLLKSPKVRGSFGEVLLGNLLADVLPQDRYELQFTLPTSREIADAIIRLQDGHIVAIDAKFPLANFEQYAQETDPAAKSKARSAVVRDIKKHITDISSKYISPSANTLDYAFMYIPVEGVYYETMVRDEQGASLWEFCLHHKVIPVSPNSFLAYLQTVLVGLRGMKIEQQAKEIMQHLGQIRQDIKNFSEEFTMVGKHITNAKNRYDDSARRLDKFTTRLDQIESTTSTPRIPKET